MCKNILRLSLVSLLFSFSSMANAAEEQQLLLDGASVLSLAEQMLDVELPAMDYSKQDGLTYNLTGTKDEGAFRLFLKPSSGKHFKLSPAIGIQFTLDFSL